MEYCRTLTFEQKPDYDYCRRLFTQLLVRNGHTPDDTDFDWIIKREEMIKKAQAEKDGPPLITVD